MLMRLRRTSVQRPAMTQDSIALPDLNMPSTRRQRALLAALKANEAARKPPCSSVHFATLGEVLWTLAHRGWCGGMAESAPVSAPDWFVRIGREGAVEPAMLRGADLHRVNLNYADLRDADLRDTDLSDSQLIDADLAGALLTEANLAGASLLRDEDIATLRALKQRNDDIQRPPYYRVAVTSRNQLEWIFCEHSWSGLPKLPDDCTRGDLSGADLTQIDLSGVDFVGVKLSGTSLIKPDEERELRRRFALNISKGRAPYAGVRLPKHQHILWIMRERRWQAEGAVEPKARINLIHADLSEALLSGISLRYANLNGANFNSANLRKSDLTVTVLRDANLTDSSLREATLLATNAERAHFDGSNLKSADLRQSKLREAILSNAVMNDSLLIEADIRGAEFRLTQLYGANLSSVRIDEETIFEGASLDAKTVLGENNWSIVSLSSIQWQKAPRLGDEIVPEIPSTYSKAMASRLHENTRREALKTYRGLWLGLRSQGLESVSRRFHLRYERLRRRQVFQTSKFIGIRRIRWLFSLALDALVGYGEAPVRTFLIYLASVFAFATVYWGLVGPASNIALHWPDWVLYSFVTFHGRGLFDNALALQHVHGWLPVTSLLESGIGITMEFIFIAAFTHRFLHS